MELARRRTLDFCEVTKADWVTAAHHRLLCDIADRVVSGSLKFAAISLPPRHTKSEIFSIRMAARYLGVYPDRRVMHISYSSALSNTFSMQVRALVRDDAVFHELFPDVQLDPDRQRIDDWHTTAGGGFKSVGVGGGISGHGANLIIIDDPLKEGDEQSMTVMRQIFEWYASAARTRLAPGGQIVMVGTRWHLSDLIGRVIDNMHNDGADQFEVINLPAIARENDLFGREEGQALWPERYDVAALMAIKSLSDRYFEALFQQDPQPDGAKLFYEAWFCRLYESISSAGAWAFDLAISEDTTADYSTWGRWLFDPARKVLQVSDLQRERQEWPETKKAILKLMDDNPDDLFLFPKQTYELMAVKELRSSRPGLASRIRQVQMTGDKRERAAVFADIASSGRAQVEPSAMGDSFVREHDRFPDEHDDWVDMSSVAAHFFAPVASFRAIFGQKADNPIPEELRQLIEAR